MTTARNLLLCCLVAAGGFLHSPRAAAADPEAEARERFERAIKLYEEGDYDAALVELKQAAELRPSYKLFYNIGQVRVAMHDYASALEAYRRYLDEGGDRIPAPRRDQVQKELKKLEQRVARLTVTTDVPGAEVTVDDAPAGVTPLSAPLLLNAGTRRVNVRHPDYLPQGRVLSLAGGVQVKLAFSLSSVTPPPTAPAPTNAPGRVAPPGPAPRSLTPPPRSPEADRSSGTPWLGWVLTGALAAGATVTGLMALSANNSLSDKRDELGASKADLDSESKRVRTLAIVTDGLAVAAIAAGGVSLWLTLGSHGAEPNKPDASSKARSQPLAVGVGLHGVRLQAHF